MTPAEKGFLLLTSRLGNPERKVLSAAQLRQLSRRAAMLKPEDRELEQEDLRKLGYGPQMADRILGLLSQEEELAYYLEKAKRFGCVPLTRAGARYPLTVRKRLGTESPGCLWARGNPELLDTPMVALVGSRELNDRNRAFAREAGRQAALQGYTLISGNARGADRTAQQACLEAGGAVIVVVADELRDKPLLQRVLYLSEEDYDQPFSAQRALSRNRIIHSLGLLTLVAQCGLETGGTWDGTTRNLAGDWTRVCCFRDGSEGAVALEQRGAALIDQAELSGLGELILAEPSLFDMQ